MERVMCEMCGKEEGKGDRMKVEIRKNRYGINAGCLICGRRQDGWRPHPLVVWHIVDDEKRGHNEPVCSRECAEKLVERLKGE